MTLAEKLAEYRTLMEKAFDDIEIVLDCVPPDGLEFLWKQGTEALDALEERTKALLDLIPLYEAVISAYADFDADDIDGSDAILQTAKSALASALDLLEQDNPLENCGLDDMSKCKSGFPGCALADDLLAVNVGVDGTVKRLLEENAKLREIAKGMHEALREDRISIEGRYGRHQCRCTFGSEGDETWSDGQLENHVGDCPARPDALEDL